MGKVEAAEIYEYPGKNRILRLRLLSISTIPFKHESMLESPLMGHLG